VREKIASGIHGCCEICEGRRESERMREDADVEKKGEPGKKKEQPT
jgi:hypothetical protein